MRSLALAILFTALSLGAANSSVVFITENGQLIGVNNIKVDRDFYNVRFIDGTCIDLFDGCDNASTDFPFNSAEAYAAMLALKDQAFNGNVYDADPLLTRGIDADMFYFGEAEILLPVHLAPAVSLVALYNRSGATPDFVPNPSIDGYALTNADFDSGTAGNSVYSVWDVPIPSTFILVAGVIAGLITRARSAYSAASGVKPMRFN